MALTKDEREKLDRTHDTVIEIKTVLLGTDSDNGMVGDLKRLAKSHYKLRTNFWLLIGILVGSGILGGSLWGFLH